MRCLPAVVWATATGVPVDRQGWLEQMAVAELERTKIQESIWAHLEERGITPEVWHKEARRWIKGKLPARVNLDSLDQVRAVLWAVGQQVPNTKAETLAQIQGEPLIELLMANSMAAVLVDTFGQKVLKDQNLVTDGNKNLREGRSGVYR